MTVRVTPHAASVKKVARTLTALGVNVDHVADKPLTIEPFGDALIIRWDGALVVTAAELERAWRDAQ